MLKYIPFVVIWYAAYSYLISVHNNVKTSLSFWVAYIFGALCPFWVIIAKNSNNLIFDGLFYDLAMFVGGFGMLILLGRAESFTLINWAGFFIVTTGFILLRL